MHQYLMLLRDAPKSRDRYSTRRYFEISYGIFLKRLGELKSLKRRLTAEEAKELQFMMNALIDAKNLLYWEK